ncbi:MAG: hypothetical protein NTW55_07295 [Planctomycetota bacterium]|nr:hypothetical protein [Planctomycetota bacterium]
MAVRTLGILFICAGIIFLVRPAIIKSLISFFKVGIGPHIAASIRITIAVILFLGVQQCRIHWVIITLGIIFLLSGLVVFAIGAKKAGSLMGWFESQPVAFIRISSLIPLAFGSIIIFSA